MFKSLTKISILNVALIVTGFSTNNTFAVAQPDAISLASNPAHSPTINGQGFAAIPNTINRSVSVFHVDPATGAFTELASSPYPVGINPTAVGFSPITNGALFLTVADINNNKAVYSVNTTTGALTPAS